MPQTHPPDPALERQISVIDTNLDILRRGLLDARPEKQDHWRAKLDHFLDRRLTLMAQRKHNTHETPTPLS